MARKRRNFATERSRGAVFIGFLTGPGRNAHVRGVTRELFCQTGGPRMFRNGTLDELYPSGLDDCSAHGSQNHTRNGPAISDASECSMKKSVDNCKEPHRNLDRYGQPKPNRFLLPRTTKKSIARKKTVSSDCNHGAAGHGNFQPVRTHSHLMGFAFAIAVPTLRARPGRGDVASRVFAGNSPRCESRNHSPPLPCCNRWRK